MKLCRLDQFAIVRALLAEGKPVIKKAFGDSMEPAIPDGAVLHINPVNPENICRGDVVLFLAAHGAPLIHRVVRCFRRSGQAYVQAWGDNNPRPDRPVPAKQLFGRVLAYETGECSVQLPSSRRVFARLCMYRYAWFYLRCLPRKVWNSIFYC